VKKTIALILVLLTMAVASGTASAKALGSGIIYEAVRVTDSTGRTLPAQANPHAFK